MHSINNWDELDHKLFKLFYDTKITDVCDQDQMEMFYFIKISWDALHHFLWKLFSDIEMIVCYKATGYYGKSHCLIRKGVNSNELYLFIVYKLRVWTIVKYTISLEFLLDGDFTFVVCSWCFCCILRGELLLTLSSGGNYHHKKCVSIRLKLTLIF